MAGRTDTEKEAHPTSPTRIVALLGLLFTIAMIGLATVFADNKHMVLLLQTFSGNWSPPNDFNDISKLEFAITAVIAIIINWGTLIAAFVLVYNFLSRLVMHEVPMASLKEILELDEEAAKLSVLKNLGTDEDTIKKVNAAFAEAASGRSTRIEKVFGSNSANNFKIMLTREI